MIEMTLRHCMSRKPHFINVARWKILKTCHYSFSFFHSFFYLDIVKYSQTSSSIPITCIHQHQYWLIAHINISIDLATMKLKEQNFFSLRWRTMRGKMWHTIQLHGDGFLETVRVHAPRYALWRHTACLGYGRLPPRPWVLFHVCRRTVSGKCHVVTNMNRDFY